MQSPDSFGSEVTGHGADMFRAVSLCFLFIHKQRPTVITSSFKYQRAPLEHGLGIGLWSGPRNSTRKHVPKDVTFTQYKPEGCLLSRFPIGSLIFRITLHPKWTVLDGNECNSTNITATFLMDISVSKIVYISDEAIN